MEFCSNFNFKIEKLVDVIKQRNVQRLYIQLPEGFQQCIKFIIDNIRRLLDRDIEIFISANPSYGSCLVDEYGARTVSADLIIHFGHTPYPYYTYNSEVLFIPVEYTGIDKLRILKIIENLNLKECDKICLATSAQHATVVESICTSIERCKCIYRDIIMGCRPVPSNDCSLLIVVSGGRFHCIAQALFEYGKNGFQSLSKILCLDPYNYNLWSPVKDVEKILKVRMWKMFQAISAKRWLIIDGFYGQHREDIVARLAELLKTNGKEYYIVKALKLDREFLINIEAGRNFDAVVVASCPYLAFDFTDLDKPVLTVGEAYSVLHGDINRYAYPW
ncbi:MAG: 2-(3-amino-3-carboxypropyl)histidine synthase subunit 1/2 [Ignisphaera sp.]